MSTESSRRGWWAGLRAAPERRRIESSAGEVKLLPALVWWLMLGAFALRVIVSSFTIDDLLQTTRDHWKFAYETGRVARSLAQGHGFSDPFFTRTGPTSWLAPVYPLVLAGVFKIFGIYTAASAGVAQMLNSLFAALTTIPLFLLSRRIFGERTARYTAIAWMLSPYSIHLAATWVWDTCLSTLLMTTLVWLTVEMAKSKPRVWWAAYGVLWGVLGLTNPVSLIVLPAFGLWLLWRHRRESLVLAARSLALAAVPCVLLIGIWVGRDYTVFHRILPIKSAAWVEFASGNLGDHVNWWNDEQHPSRSMAEYTKYQRMGELAYVDSRKAEVISYIRSHPGEYALLSLRRIGYIWFGFWSFSADYLVDEPLDPVNIVVCSTISLTALGGIWLAMRRRYDLLFPSLATLALWPLVYYLTHPTPSYRHPVEPQLVLFGTFFAWPALQSAWRRSWVRAAGVWVAERWEGLSLPQPAPVFVPEEMTESMIEPGTRRHASALDSTLGLLND